MESPSPEDAPEQSLVSEAAECVEERPDGNVTDIDAPTSRSASIAESENPEKQKITILLKATGDAPIMKVKKWTVDPEKTVGWVIEFVKRALKLQASDSLFLYVNQVFAPSPDQILRNLYNCFGSSGKLVLHYCRTPAWG